MAIGIDRVKGRRMGEGPSLPREGRSSYLATVLLLVAVAGLSYGVRRSYLRAFFPDGISGPAPVFPEAGGEPLPRVERVRVVILDGLSLSTAQTLPNLSRLCAQGIDLVADMGFPTVSLPIQHVLFSGLT